MDVFVLVGLRNVSVSIVDDCRVKSRFKKFICLLYSCVGLNFVSFCIRFKLAVSWSWPIVL
jgi:hypothetical protein